MKGESLPKIITVVGPTASGKSDLAVDIAKRFNGEVVSADSRQVYKGMDIGTGKITEKEMKGVPHHMLDIASPKRRFTVLQYQKKARKAIAGILARGKVPIICGGTGFYIDAITQNIEIPRVPTNSTLRIKLEKTPLDELVELLKEKDPRRASDIDLKNPRRIIRALEIVDALGKVPEQSSNSSGEYDVLHIGIKADDEVLRERIHARLLKRMNKGMLAEVERLHTEGVSWKRMEELGLEYRYLARFLQGFITKPEMLERLNIEIRKYAKRQRTWLKRNKDIKWFELSETLKAKKEVKKFLNS